VPADIKQERADEIMAIQEEISLSINQQKIGKTLKVLFDRTEGGYFIGRTEHDSPEVDNEVLVKAEEKAYARMGDFALVNISSATEFDLYGTLA
jgi:ribosomal protein S12 methylthiotransferase